MTQQTGWNALPRKMVRFAKRRLGSTVRARTSGPAFEPGGELEEILHTRSVIAQIYLRGQGLEIGALHQPLAVPPSVHVRYVDRMSAPELQRHYHELSHLPLVETDIVDNGEELAKVSDDSQDFVIANHFLEHCQNPIRTFQNFLRVLKPGGAIYLAVPDKRFTFDADRPSTTVEHVMRDFAEGPEWSKRQHFEEWCRLVNKCAEADVDSSVEHLLKIDYSIHFHVWRAADLLELVSTVQRFLSFEVELFLRNGFETVLILRKASS